MDSVRYSIPSLSSNEAFSINAETGALSSGFLDRETQSAYLIIVAAVDSGRPIINTLVYRKELTI